MNYKIAEFSSRLPKGSRPKAVVVFVPGSNDDGRDFPDYRGMRKWADRHSVATVGCKFEDINPDAIEGYADAKGGSGQALLDFLAKQKLSNLPIYLWGFSAGGQFNYEFACWKPELVKAFVVNKGGFYYTALAPEATRRIPGLFFTGRTDQLNRRAIVIGIYLMNKRDPNCVWDFVDEDTGHLMGDSLKLGLEFFERELSK